MEPTVESQLKKLSYHEIVCLARGRCKISHVAQGRKENVVDEVLRSASPKLLSEMVEEVIAKDSREPLDRK